MKEKGRVLRLTALLIILMMVGGGVGVLISDLVSQSDGQNAEVEQVRDTTENQEGNRAALKGAIYAIQKGGCQYTTKLLRYDVGANSWSNMADFPARMQNNQVNNKMAFDGKDNIYAMRQANSGDWYKYTISTNTWTKMSPNLPSGSYYSPGLVYAEVGNNHYIYYHRGYASSNFYRYDIDQGTWSSMAGQYIYYYGTSIVYADGYVYTNYGYRNNDFYRYDCANNRGSRMSNLPRCYYRGPTFTYDGGD